MRAFTDADRVVMADPVFTDRYVRASRHDAQADGQFVTAWRMSENFCRPGCQSRTPRPSRVVFYRTTAAAYAAGFVPCPRCRPDMTPPAYDLRRGDSIAARALRLIDDGLIDRSGVAGLARSIGVSPRHVLRAVTSVAECGPLDVARAHRARAARLLLTATSIPMRDVATAAGFATVRQFNATILQLFRATPGMIRYGRRRVGPASRDPGPLVVRLVLSSYGTASQSVFAGLTARAVPEIEEGGDHWFARTVRLPRGPGHLRVDVEASGRLLAKLSVADLRDFIPLLHRTEILCARALGLAPAEHDSAATDQEEALIRAAVEARAPLGASRTILGGLVSALGDVTPWGRLFPTADAVVRSGREVLRGPSDRVDGILRVAESIASKDIDTAGSWSWQTLLTRHGALIG